MEFDEVVTPKKDVNQLSSWLHEHAVVTPISLSAFSKSFIEHLAYNAVNAITNQRVQADQNELEFVCYKLEKVADNKKYNYALSTSHESFVYVIFEKKTGYILSNSSRLHLELVLAQGVTQEDINENSFYMQYYVFCRNEYPELCKQDSER